MAWLIDDIDLSTLAWNISNRSAGWGVPARRGDNLTIPGRHGTQWVANKPFDEGSATLNMWALGSNPDGSMPADGNLRRMCRFNLDKLTALFGQTSRLLNVVQVESSVYGGKNMVTNPGFESLSSSNQFTYQNSILNPAGRATSSQTVLTNVFPNPNMSGLISSTFAQRSENLALDPEFVYQKDVGDTIGASNYIYPSNFEASTTGATPTHWSTGAGTAGQSVELVVVANSATDRSQQPYSGTKLLRMTTSISTPAATFVVQRDDPFYVGAGHVPGISFWMRRSTSSVAGAYNLQMRVFNFQADQTTRYNFSDYLTVPVPASTTAWTLVQFTPTGGTWSTTGSDTDYIGFEMINLETWPASVSICFDQFACNLVSGFTTSSAAINNSVRAATAGFWSGKAGPFFNGDSAWGNLTAPGETALTRWNANVDARWIADAAIDDSSPYYTFADRPVGSSVLNFVAMAFKGAQTIGFNAPLASPTAGQAYVLRFKARAAAGAACSVKLLKQGTGDASPVTVATVNLTGSGTPVASGSRMSGTVFDYESTKYIAVAGDQMWVRVEMPSRTDGFPIFQFSSLSVQNGRPAYYSGDTADTATIQYAWSGTQYNSKTLLQMQRVNRIVNSSAQGASTQTVSGATVQVAQADVGYDGQPSALVTDNLPIGSQQGLWVAADLWGFYSNPARPTAGVTVTAQLVVELLSSAGGVLATVNSTSAAVNTPGFPKKFSVRISQEAIPTGAVNYRVSAKIVSPIAGQYLELVDLLVSPFGLDPTLVGAPSYFDGTTTGASWVSLPNNSSSVWKTTVPSNWSATPGLLIGGSGVVSTSPLMTTSLAQVCMTAPLGSAAVAGPYLVGLNLTPQCLSSAGVALSTGDVSVLIQAIATDGTVSGMVSAGTMCADSSVTGQPQYIQGILSPTTSFTALAFWIVASTGVSLLKVSIAQAYLMPVSGSYTNPNQRLDFNGIYNPALVAGTKGWKISGTTALVDIASGKGLQLTGTAKASTGPVSAGPTGSVRSMYWGAVGNTGSDPLTISSRVGAMRTNLALDPRITGSRPHGTGGSATITYDSKGAKVVSTGSTAGAILVEQTTQGADWDQPGHTYTVSASWHTDSTAPFAGAAPYLALSGDTGISTKSAIGNPYEGDGRVALTFTLPSTYTSLGIRLVNSSPTPGDTVWWTDLLIEETPGATVTPEVVTRTNLALMPNPGPVAGGWNTSSSGSYAVTRDSAFVRRAGTWSAKGVPLASGQVGIAGFARVGLSSSAITGYIPITVGQTYTFSVYWAANVANPRYSMSVTWWDETLTQVGIVAQATTVTSFNANTWNRTSFTVTAPTGATRMRPAIVIDMPTGLTTTGSETAWVTDCQVEVGSVTNAYIDGDLAPSGSTHFRWTGADNASASQSYTPAVYTGLGAYFDGSQGSVTGLENQGWNGAVDASTSEAFDYTQTDIGTIGSVALSQAFSVITVPATASHAELAFSGAGAIISSAYLAQPSGAAVDRYQVLYDFFPYFDGASTVGPLGEKVSWAGTANASVSRAIPHYPVGWGTPTGPTSVALHQLTANAPAGSTMVSGRPSGAKLGWAIIPRQMVLNTAKIYRLNPAVAAGESDFFLSGEIALRKSAGVTLKIDLMMAASSTGTGISAWSQTVGSTASAFNSVVSWANVPITAAYYYFQVTYTETFAAAGYRVSLDDLLLLPSSAPMIGDDYPGYFDGSTNGSDWDGADNASTSTYFGGGRRCYAEVRDAIDMTSMAGGTRAEFSVNLAIPGAFWEDLLDSSITLSVTNAQLHANSQFPLDALTQGTAPIDDAVITVVPSGTVTGLVITDIATGATLSLSGNVPSAGVIFDCGNFTAMSGNTSVIRSVTRAGSNGFLPLTPVNSTTPPTLAFSATGTGTLTVTVVARRRYLIA